MEALNEITRSDSSKQKHFQNEMLQCCTHSSRMLMNLVDDLLDAAKCSIKKFKLNKQKFDLIGTIKNSFNMLQYLSSQKNIEMTLGVEKKHE